MSTYIVAYTTGPFSYLETSYKSPLSGTVRPVRVYGTSLSPSLTPFTSPTQLNMECFLLVLLIATEDVISQAQYSLDVAERVLPLFDKAFGVEYPLPKFDTFVVCGGAFFSSEILTELGHSSLLLLTLVGWWF